MSDHPSPYQPESGGSSNWQPDDGSGRSPASPGPDWQTPPPSGAQPWGGGSDGRPQAKPEPTLRSLASRSPILPGPRPRPPR